MELVSLSGIVVVFFDFLFTSLFITTVLLSVLHVYNHSIGTDLDWLVAIMFGIVYAVYNYCLSQTVQFNWNRTLEYSYILVAYIGYVVFFVALFREAWTCNEV